jgi:hypothetical protein
MVLDENSYWKGFLTAFGITVVGFLRRRAQRFFEYYGFAPRPSPITKYHCHLEGAERLREPQALKKSPACVGPGQTGMCMSLKNYLRTPSSFPTLVKAVIHLSRCLRSCPADS